jgi:hypothetical protein
MKEPIGKNLLGMDLIDFWTTTISGKEVEFRTFHDVTGNQEIWPCMCKIDETTFGPEIADHQPTREEVQLVFSDWDSYVDQLADGPTN